MLKKDKKVEEEVLEVESVKEEKSSQKIEVGDPQKLRPTELPLVVKLPEGASKAQIEFAKVLNAYAYKNPTKWHQKKGKLIKQLEALINAPDPVESRLKINKSGF